MYINNVTIYINIYMCVCVSFGKHKQTLYGTAALYAQDYKLNQKQ